MTKLLLIAIAVVGLANSLVSSNAQPPLLIDSGTPPTLDAQH